MIIYKVIKLVILFIVVFYNTNSMAKPNSSDSTKITNVESNYTFDVSFFTDYAIGYQIYKASNSEIRILLDLYVIGNSDEDDRITTELLSDTTISRKILREDETVYYRVSLSTHYLVNIYKSSLGEAYFGIGPFIGYKWNKQQYISKEDGNETDNENTSSQTDYSVGLTTLLGIRAKLNNSTSFFAEVQLSGGKSWGDSEHSSIRYYEYNNSTEIYKSVTKTNSWFYNHTYARIGLRFSI